MADGSSRQSLSSMWTIIDKFIFPTLWIGGFGLGIIGVLFSEPGMDGGFIFAFFSGCLFFYFFCLPLKSVETDGKFLYVSNYRKTIQIPVSEIERVTETPFINTHPVWIKFKTPTEFGSKIIFEPCRHFGSLFMWSHPVVATLKELAKIT